MSKYEIVLDDDQEKNLTRLAREKRTSKQTALSWLAKLLLSSAHTMNQGEIEKAYDECSELYLSICEKGTD